MKNLKRVFKYVKGRYRFFYLSIIMIIFVQALGFITPLLVKTILDDYILGIEYEWVEVRNETDKAVQFDGHYYKQVRFINDDEWIEVKDGSDPKAIQIDNHYYLQKMYLNFDDDVIYEKGCSIIVLKTRIYFTDDKVAKGPREVNNNVLTVTTDDGVINYNIQALTAKEVTLFYNPIIPMLILFIIFIFVKSVLVIAGTWVQHISTNRMVSWIAQDARTDAMRSIERLPIKYFESEPAGKMAARITSDVDGMIIMYRILVNVVVSTILSFILAYVGMFMLDIKLALITLLGYPIIYIWVRFFLKSLKKLAEKVNEFRSMLTAKINEIINGINILQIFNFKKQTVTEFNEINDNFKNEQLKEVKLHITSGWNMIGIIRGIITTVIIAYFGWQYFSISDIVITAGLIYAYNEYLLKIMDPINAIFVNVSEFQHSMVRIERISKLIEGELEEATTGEIKRYFGDIVFDNIWFAYKENTYVLKGVSLDIKRGQMVGLVGHTGSGKSSLMNLLLRFYDIDDEKSGRIYVDGMDISSIPKRIYRNHIGIVLQEPTLFKGTIASNIRFGRDDVSDEEIEKILISIGGDKLIKKFEKGINQPISRAGVNMSSGEKQIISLARVIVHNPSILIMDEATSHIDTETEEMIKQALKVVCKDRTVIVIAHRLSTIYNADNIIVLDHGLKVEEGTHKQLVEKNGVYANMYRAQQANVDRLANI